MIRARLVVTFALFAALALAGPAAGGSNRIAVTVDRTAVSTSLGHKFSVRSRIVNNGGSAVSGLIAHLNVLSLRPEVYLDPEDWSSHRTRYLPAIPAGGSVTIDWKMQAVNAGSIGVFIAVLPRHGEPKPPATGRSCMSRSPDARRSTREESFRSLSGSRLCLRRSPWDSVCEGALRTRHHSRC